jgi:GNAT superfamily N-acetyltransferase
MRIVELDAEGPAVERVYNEILTPSFPADEMCPLKSVQTMADAGLGLVWAAVDDEGETLGCAVGDWDAELRVMLLSWLAVRPGLRGGGIGGPLLSAAMTEWQRRCAPCLILAEVENPEQRQVSDAYGDPIARLRFYQRRGARILDLPYFQAALGPEKSRVYNLFLMVLHADPSFAGAGEDTIDGEVLRKYLEKYQIQCEGVIGTDDDAVRLWQAVSRSNGVALLPVRTTVE